MVVYFILLIRQLQLLYSCNWTAVHLDHCFSCIVNWQHWIAVLFCLFSILLRSACWCLEVQVLMKGLLQITWPNLTWQQALFFGIKSSRIKWSYARSMDLYGSIKGLGLVLEISVRNGIQVLFRSIQCTAMTVASDVMRDLSFGLGLSQVWAETVPLCNLVLEILQLY